MYEWFKKATKAEFRHISNGRLVYKVGPFLLDIESDKALSSDDCRVTFRYERGATMDPRATFPNMDIEYDRIMIPITDFVPLILSRLEPEDLARALWDNDAVKAAFIECLVTRYNQDGIDDADRRKVLAGVKEAVHDKALDVLINMVAKAEWEVLQDYYHSQQVHRINDYLDRLDIKTHDGKRLRIEWASSNPIHSVSGQAWTEARAFWREEILKRFPEPEDGK